MGKRRKTRKEKIIASLRHQLETTQPEQSPSVPLPSASVHQYRYTASVTSPVVHTAHVTSARDTKKDLFKSALFSAMIVGGEIVLFTILKKHILILPFLHY